jgi:hypothetical protein
MSCSQRSNASDSSEGSRVPEAAHVVVAATAAEDEHALVAERRERLAECHVPRGIETADQRELDRRHVGVGPRDLERNERAVIEPALRVGRGLEAAAPRSARTRSASADCRARAT